MPRKPKIITFARQIREITGMTQKKFAERLGINFHTYQDIDNGRRPLSPAVQDAIQSAAGAVPSSVFYRLPKGEADFPVGWPDLSGNYTRERYLDFLKRGQPGNPKFETKKAIERFTDSLTLLMEAADTLNQSPAAEVMGHICAALSEARKNFGLEKATDRLLSQMAWEQTYRFPYGKLRGNPSFAALFKFRDKQHHPDGSIVSNDDICEVTTTVIPKWSAGGLGVPQRTEISQPSESHSSKRRRV